MTMNCDYDIVVSVISPVVNEILPIVHLILRLTKTHPLFYTFCQKHSGCVFASGKNGSTPAKLQNLSEKSRGIASTSNRHSLCFSHPDKCCAIKGMIVV